MVQQLVFFTGQREFPLVVNPVATQATQGEPRQQKDKPLRTFFTDIDWKQVLHGDRYESLLFLPILQG